MNCYQVTDHNGRPDGNYTKLLGKHKGNEEKALEEFAESLLKSGRTNFFLGSSITDPKGFVNALFRVRDEFTLDDERNYRRQLDVQLVPVKDSMTGLDIVKFHSMGSYKTAPASEKNAVIDLLVEERKSLKNEVADKMLKAYHAHKSGNMEAEAKKQLGEESYGLIKSSLHGLNPSEVKAYSDFSGEPWYIPSLADEKILVHVKMLSGGEKVYSLILPTHTHGNSQYGDSGDSFIGAKFLGSNTLSEAQGITIAENLKGRKQLVASILAASIKGVDPKASVESARFVSFSGQGVLNHLDINHGSDVLKQLLHLPGLGDSLPTVLENLKNNPSIIDSVGQAMDYVSFLFEEYDSVFDSGNDKKEFKEAFGRNEKKRMLDAVNRQMYRIMRTHGRIKGGRPEYEDTTTKAGKEMLMLARAKQQLMMLDGFDYRGKNSFNEMGFLESWINTQGEYANVDLNLVMQEVAALEEGAKHRFKNGHVKRMKAAVDKFIRDNKGANAKGVLFNDTQAYFGNLYQTTKVRQMGEDGNLSADFMEVNIQKFKDPNDTSNNLSTAERVFIREVIALHRESLVKMMDKKIKDGLVKDFSSGAEWYDKKYKSQELLLPVTRKSSSEIFANGDFKQAGSAWLEDFTNVYNLNDQGQSNKEYIFGRFGSGTMQLGGEFGSESRLKSLGLEYVNEELVLISPKKNSSASKNAEQALNMSAFNNEKAALQLELETVYAAGRVNMLNDRIADRSKEAETLKAMFENLVYGDMEKTKFTKNRDAMKTVNGIRKMTSMGTLTLNWKSALLATVGANISLMSDAMSQRYGEHFFNIRDYGKAQLWIGQNPAKFDKLIDLFMFHESDEVDLMFSDRYQASQRGLYKSRYNMIMHSAGDRLLRGVILVSQMIHDGIIDNFDVTQEGELVYNWNKDTRHEEQKKAIQQNLTYRGVDNLPYDEVMMRSLTTISGKIMGSFTDADKARFQTHEGAKVFAQFKAYLGARLTNLYSQGFENVNIRHYKVGSDGQLTVQNYYQEGIFQSTVHMFKEIQRLKSLTGSYEALRPEQQANVRKLFIDVMLFAGSMGLYQLIKSALDDDDENRVLYQHLEYAMMDMVGIYNPADYLMSLASPVSVQYMERIVTMAYNLAILDFEKSHKNAISLLGPLRSADDILKLLGED